MDIETLLHQLHYDPDKSKPADWQVDWEDAPLPYKLYRDLPRITLCSEIPLSLEPNITTMMPTTKEIGPFLWYVYGITQMSHSPFIPQQLRRFVPSGGALYPSECYIYLNITDLSPGIYHYDVAHHELVLLREGNFDSFLAKALGDRCDLSTCFGTVFVTTMFWKNFFKYHYFAYRLQGLDAGATIGQLLEVAKCFGFESKVAFQFLDQAINQLLGIDENEESVYAVIPLALNHVINMDSTPSISTTTLCQGLEPITCNLYTKSKRIKESPLLRQINEASFYTSTSQFQRLATYLPIEKEGRLIPLPSVEQSSTDFVSICKQRYSPGEDFRLEEINQTQLATLLKTSMDNSIYQNDLEDLETDSIPRVEIACCLYNIEDIPNGAYIYDRNSHTLQLQKLGDHRAYLQQSMTMHTINLHQVPICLHVIGDQDHLMTTFGYRGYRIQQMEAGVLVQRLLLVATALGMNGHPLLGFDVNACDQLYHLQGKTSLIQIPIGFCRPRTQLVGNLI